MLQFLKLKKNTLRVSLGLFITLIFLFSAPFAFASMGDTYIIPIKGDIGNGNLFYVQRAYVDAITSGAGAIIFEIDTYGGSIDTALKFKDLIMSSQVPTVCFVDNKAISAGVLIALAGEKLVMRPGTTIGAAEPRLGSEKADEKTVSMWSGQLAAVAEARGKDGKIAAAMADSDIAIEGLVEKDKLLTLGSQQALSLGFIDAVLDSRAEVMEEYSLPGEEVEIEPTLRENAVKWLSSPYIAAILLTLGIAGVIIELFIPGFGVFGVIGVLSFIAFFLGNFWAGSAGWGSIILFLVGMIFIAVEVFVIPGFGVTGILGIAAMIAGIFLASPSAQYAIISLLIAIIASIILIVISVKNRKTRKIWRKIILSQKQENSEGYSSQDLEQNRLLNAYGKAITPLRPAGTALINGNRVDVVTEGQFVVEGASIQVVSVSGGRVVVKEGAPENTPPAGEENNS